MWSCRVSAVFLVFATFFVIDIHGGLPKLSLPEFQMKEFQIPIPQFGKLFNLLSSRLPQLQVQSQQQQQQKQHQLPIRPQQNLQFHQYRQKPPQRLKLTKLPLIKYRSKQPTPATPQHSGGSLHSHEDLQQKPQINLATYLLPHQKNHAFHHHHHSPVSHDFRHEQEHDHKHHHHQHHHDPLDHIHQDHEGKLYIHDPESTVKFYYKENLRGQSNRVDIHHDGCREVPMDYWYQRPKSLWAKHCITLYQNGQCKGNGIQVAGSVSELRSAGMHYGVNSFKPCEKNIRIKFMPNPHHKQHGHHHLHH